MPRSALAPAVDPLQEMREQIAALTARVERLERGTSSPAQRAADAELMAILAGAVGSAWFTARELLSHARVDHALAEALDKRLLEDERGIGCALRRLAKRQDGSIRISRGEKCSEGRLWRVSVDPL